MPGMRAISVPVTVTSGISGFIFPGDRVDLVLTYPGAVAGRIESRQQRKGLRAQGGSQTVLRDMRVIGIDQRLDGKPGEAVVAHTATLEVTPKQSEIIALASEIGKVSLTLRSLVPAAEEGRRRRPPSDGRCPIRGMADATSFTLDSEISPLLPQLPVAESAPGVDFGGPAEGERRPAQPGPVTILRGSWTKRKTASATEPAEKGS